MTANRSVQLSLELEPRRNGFGGSLRDEFGRQHRFSSWLSLLQLLEAAHGRAERTYTDTRPQEAQ